MSHQPAVRAWEEPVVIPTYPAPPADRNPMFLDRRVYQGSSGKVYPLPFTDRVSDRKVDKQYKAVHLENEYVRLMILPEIGGRIHIATDKTNNYDFFYRQNVIKPALVGLAGPWISGGVEFNWPQHHRPSTFMPVEHSIEEHADGSRTVWLSEHEPMNRMKGMVGICLHPGKALVEAKVRLYNRTPLMQTFLWWANAGIRVHEHYQAFFPPDVTFVADHAKRAMSSYPIARNFYYGVDYTRGVDISWYKNIPVPTSYMVTQSAYDFFGGYDHDKRAGVVHVADHHIAPGKKLWTWGNAQFGYAWDRELTDADGPYIELMAGVYTDNQPDFSFLHPYETRCFSQFWYPIQEIGPAKNANRLLAANLEPASRGWRVGVAASESLEVSIELAVGSEVVFERPVKIAPGKPFVATVPLSGSFRETELLLRVLDPHGRELIRYQPVERRDAELPPPAREPAPPSEIGSNDELYVTGLHLEQYRHATRAPEMYWDEALRRDPEDARCNNALGLLALRRGQFDRAEENFRRAIARMTVRNPNPRDGEPYYNLGLALRYQGKDDEAYAAYYKAAWSYPWQSAAYYSLAAIDCSRGDYTSALDHVERSLRTNADHLKARNLKGAVLRKRGRAVDARAIVTATIGLDPLDFWSRWELLLLDGKSTNDVSHVFDLMRRDAQTCFDLGLDYAFVGMFAEAADVLTAYQEQVASESYLPTIDYTLGWLFECLGDEERADDAYRQAAARSPEYCFPARLEEMIVLEAALRRNPDDARAHYYLGNLLYDKHRREEAIGHWERSAALDPAFSIPLRNLGIAYFNVRQDPPRALASYEAARTANPSDARLLYEYDQLRKRTGAAPEDRLAELERNSTLIAERDDLTVELVSLYNQTGRSERALEILRNRRFHPWEGGEGLVSGQYVLAHLLLGRQALACHEPAAALEHFDAARTYPHSLGEGKHLLTNESHLDYFSGVALAHLGRDAESKRAWTRAAKCTAAEDMFAYYRALALRSVGDETAAREVLKHLLEYANRQLNADVKIDYFATSLPNMLLFQDDLRKRNRIECQFLRGLASLGMGKRSDAAADLEEVLAADRNHVFAAMELRELATAAQESAGRG